MVVTAEMLHQQIATMRNSIAAYSGAIEFAEHLLKVLEQPDSAGGGDLTVNEFAEMVAGPGAVAMEPAAAMSNGQG